MLKAAQHIVQCARGSMASCTRACMSELVRTYQGAQPPNAHVVHSINRYRRSYVDKWQIELHRYANTNRGFKEREFAALVAAPSDSADQRV